MIKIGDLYALDFVLYNPATGLPMNADGAVVCQVYADQSATPVQTPTVSQRLVSAGAYMAVINTTGFAEGVIYTVHVTATLAGNPLRNLVDAFIVSSVRLSDLSPPAGLNAVTITVEIISTATPLPDVLVAVYNSAETLLLASLRTGVLGQAVFALDNGTYKIRLQKAGFSFTTPETVVVAGTMSATLDGTPAPALSWGLSYRENLVRQYCRPIKNDATNWPDATVLPYWEDAFQQLKSVLCPPYDATAFAALNLESTHSTNFDPVLARQAALLIYDTLPGKQSEAELKLRDSFETLLTLLQSGESSIFDSSGNPLTRASGFYHNRQDQQPTFTLDTRDSAGTVTVSGTLSQFDQP